MKDITISESMVTIRSKLKEESLAKMNELADEILKK